MAQFNHRDFLEPEAQGRLVAAGLRSKRQAFANGRVQGGGAFSRGQIHQILTNPVYRGLTRHKEKTWPGTHPAILDEDRWSQVQQRLQSASARRRGTRNTSDASHSTNPNAPLLGKFRDETGEPLTPTHTQRHERRLRYYVSNSLVTGKRSPKEWRLPAVAFEQTVATVIADHPEAKAARHQILQTTSLGDAGKIATRIAAFVNDIRRRGASAASAIISKGEVAAGALQIVLDREALGKSLDLSAESLDADLVQFTTPFTCRRRGVKMKIVVGGRHPPPDLEMIPALRNAHRWTGMLKSGSALKDIAKREGFSESYVGRIIPLAMLSTKIQNAIVTGSQPLELNLETLVRARLPLDWSDQERCLGSGPIDLLEASRPA